MAVCAIGIAVGRHGAPIKLAVLPFENLTGDPEQEYFSDGLTDEMITQLGRLQPDRLRVIARSSAMQYKNHESPIEAMARELGVDYVLEGSARREGNRIRINATLVQVRDRTQRWSQSFDRELSGILTLQNDVARGVSGALALTLLPDDQSRLASARPVNPAVYEAYLVGRSHERRLTRPELDRALSTFETAVNLDPDFALAHFGISECGGHAFSSASTAGPRDPGAPTRRCRRRWRWTTHCRKDTWLLATARRGSNGTGRARNPVFGARSISTRALPKHTCSIPTISTSPTALRKGRRRSSVRWS